MSNPSNKIPIQVPLYYHEYAQNFMLFMQRYYDWMHRTCGLSQEEVQYLIDNSDIKDAVSRNVVLNPGASSDLLADFINLEEIHQEFVTSDEEYFEGSDEIRFQTHIESEESIDGWKNSFGIKTFGQTVDKTLMISLMKHINAIKGTEKSIELFFSIYFDEEVEVYYPKFDIATIDDNMVPDVSGVIRDDYYYNEYAYVVRVTGELNSYTELFDEIYMKNVHPSGFKVFLEKK